MKAKVVWTNDNGERYELRFEGSREMFLETIGDSMAFFEHLKPETPMTRQFLSKEWREKWAR